MRSGNKASLPEDRPGKEISLLQKETVLRKNPFSEWLGGKTSGEVGV